MLLMRPSTSLMNFAIENELAVHIDTNTSAK